MGGRNVQCCAVALAIAAAAAPASASPVPRPPQLWVMNADGTDRRLVASNATWSPHPDWSPDGRYLAYTAYEAGGISVVAADGTAPPVSIAIGDHADWSPDGSLIAFVHSPYWNGGPGPLYVVRPDGTGLTAVADDAAPGDVEWSPDGSRIAYHRCHETPCRHSLAVVGRAGDGGSVLAPAEFATTMSWAPDGSAVTFGAGGDVWVVDVGSGEVRNLTPGAAFELDPHWSPQGRIAFTESPRGSFVVDSDGTDRTFVHDGGGPRWSPDGARVLTTWHGDLFVTAPGAAGSSNLTYSDTIEYGGLWSPDGGRIAYLLDPAPEPGGRRHERSVSASLSGRVVLGKLRVADGFRACADGMPVLLQRYGRRGWKTIEKSRTNARGRFAFELGRDGLYRAKAPRAWTAGESFEPDECAATSTPPLRYRP